MSPLKRPLVLDNDVISRLYNVGALHRALEVWPRLSFRVTDYVVEEARQWPVKGKTLVGLLENLEAEEILTFISIDESSKEEISTYATLLLGNRLGQGESASLAIAYHRGFDIATDDRVAIDMCKAKYPSNSVFNTGALLNMAVQDGLMTRIEVDAIWARIRRASKE